MCSDLCCRRLILAVVWRVGLGGTGMEKRKADWRLVLSHRRLWFLGVEPLIREVVRSAQV